MKKVDNMNKTGKNLLVIAAIFVACLAGGFLVGQEALAKNKGSGEGGDNTVFEGGDSDANTCKGCDGTSIVYSGATDLRRSLSQSLICLLALLA